MDEEKKELIIKPDPSLMIKKIIKPCLVWHHQVFGILLILGGVWWYLFNLEIVSSTALWPGIIVLLGILILAENCFLWKKIEKND